MAAVAAAAALPEAWFEPPPELRPPLPPIVPPATFLRGLLVFDAALALLWAAGLLSWPVRPTQEPTPIHDPEPPVAAEPGRPLVWLGLLTLAGAALRLWELDAQLWLDEAAVLIGFGVQSTLDVLFATPGVNNHLLYTLAMRLSIDLLGDAAWAARLPAALAGVATIPAVYLLARHALPHRDSLLAAAMVAFSYHHVFFSQNARGYTLLILLWVLGTATFLRALDRDTALDWALYAAATTLACATILFGVFLPAGHAVVWGWLVLRRWRDPARRAFPRGAWRPVIVWGGVGLALLHLNAGTLPNTLSTAATDFVWSGGPVYDPGSWERIGQLWRGLSAGLGGAAIVGIVALTVPLLLGLPAFLRRHPVFFATLVLPFVVQLAVVFRLSWSPRFFLPALPVALILAVGMARTGPWGRILPLLVAGAFVAVSIASLPGYYRTPKQATRDSVAWIAGRADAGDVIVPVDVTRWGAERYAPEAAPGMGLQPVRSVDSLDALEARVGSRSLWLLTTFETALRYERPDLHAAIARDYRPVARFPASVEGGEITVWRPASAPPSRRETTGGGPR